MDENILVPHGYKFPPKLALAFSIITIVAGVAGLIIASAFVRTPTRPPRRRTCCGFTGLICVVLAGVSFTYFSSNLLMRDMKDYQGPMRITGVRSYESRLFGRRKNVFSKEYTKIYDTYFEV